MPALVAGLRDRGKAERRSGRDIKEKQKKKTNRKKEEEKEREKKKCRSRGGRDKNLLPSNRSRAYRRDLALLYTLARLTTKGKVRVGGTWG